MCLLNMPNVQQPGVDVLLPGDSVLRGTGDGRAYAELLLWYPSTLQVLHSITIHDVGCVHALKWNFKVKIMVAPYSVKPL